MKKLLPSVLFTSASVCLISLAMELFIFHPDLSAPYEGLPDDFRGENKEAWGERCRSTFGALAKYSDIIAIGNVVTQDKSQIIVRVDIPLVGCTNNQPVKISLSPFPDEIMPWVEHAVPGYDMSRMFPTNNAHIIFCVYSNYNQGVWGGYIDWRRDYTNAIPEYVDTEYRLWHDKRSWWHTNRDNGLVLEHFTNIIQAVRHERNWTNYFHLTRDGANMNSIRIKEDSFYDMRDLCVFANTAQEHFINNDPLVLPEHKELLFKEYDPWIMFLKNEQ